MALLCTGSSNKNIVATYSPHEGGKLKLAGKHKLIQKVDNTCILVYIFNIPTPDSVFVTSNMVHGHFMFVTPGGNMSLLPTVAARPFSSVLDTHFNPGSNRLASFGRPSILESPMESCIAS